MKKNSCYVLLFFIVAFSAVAQTPSSAISSVSKEFVLANDNVDRCSKAQDLAVLLQQMRNSYAYMHNGYQEGEKVCTEHRKELHAFLFKASYKHVQLLQKVVLDVLDDLDQSLRYWRDKKAHTIRYWFSKNPSKWFEKKPQLQEIEEHLSHTMIVYKYHAQFLGQLNHQLQTWGTIASDEEYYDWSVRSATVVRDFLLDQRQEDCVVESYSYPELLGILGNNLKESIKYKERIRTTSGKACKPQHVIRYWIPYTAGIAATATIGTYLFYNRHNIGPWKDHGKKVVENFYQKWIRCPYDRLKEIIWDDVYEDKKTSLWQKVKQPTKILNDAADKGFFSGNKERLQLTFAMASAAPIILLAQYTTKGIFKAASFFKPKPYEFEIIKNYLREIQRVLNRYNVQQPPVMRFEDQGLLCYYLYRLRTEMKHVPKDIVYAFDADLQELESYEFEVQQKIGTVNRMLFSYNFLTPGYAKNF